MILFGFGRACVLILRINNGEQGGKKWALRNIKLRMSRKIIFLKGLLMCASNYQNPDVSVQDLKSGLKQNVSMKPLDFIVGELVKFKIAEKWIIQLLDTYDNFLGMLNDDKLREDIQNLPMEDVYNDKEFLKARKNAHLFQEDLNQIFFYEDTPLKQFTIKYGLF